MAINIPLPPACTTKNLPPECTAKKCRLMFNGLVAAAVILALCMIIHAHQMENWEELAMDHHALMETPPVIIAYAVSITGFNAGDNILLDRAAVLHQSVKRATQRSTKFPHYHMYAFVHPDAAECIPSLNLLGYRVRMRETPFNITDIPNPEFVDAQRIGCCGEREYLKLYSYLLFDYPVVVHLDLDAIVLRSMDDVFSVLVDPTYNATNFIAESTMWAKNTPHIAPRNEVVNFLFTRDYNMVHPHERQVHEIGVQGGFLVVRPNQRDFDRMLGIIMRGGDGFTDSNWGGPGLFYGGYYGAGTIQGLASYYYSHYEKLNRSIELNRCYYNTMAESPYGTWNDVTTCLTMEETCEDCRKTPLNKVYTAHFTVCGKPDWCQPMNSESDLCNDLFREWHKTRLSLEEEWKAKFPGYDPQLRFVNASESNEAHLLSHTLGHCHQGEGYIPITFPNVTVTLI